LPPLRVHNTNVMMGKQYSNFVVVPSVSSAPEAVTHIPERTKVVIPGPDPLAAIRNDG
jgi:hypothetical protein